MAYARHDNESLMYSSTFAGHDNKLVRLDERLWETAFNMAIAGFPCCDTIRVTLDQRYLINHAQIFKISTFGFETFISDPCTDD
jgi:hypothetical protein